MVFRGATVMTGAASGRTTNSVDATLSPAAFCTRTLYVPASAAVTAARAKLLIVAPGRSAPALRH
jgi:hypothetical protein